MRLALIAPSALFLGSLAACYDDCDDCDNPCDSCNPLVFFEVERNDTPQTANDFGVLFPGDHFFIDGFIQDGGFDPFDGFAFTAGQPLHVDFQLFIDDPSDDLDVCLYDPEIDQTVACFQTADNPERGGVEVTAANLAFQLVVESFRGSSNYELEIVVQPLFVASPDAARARPAEEALIAGIDAASAPGRHLASQHAYRRERPVLEVLRIEQELSFDPQSGFLFGRVRLMPIKKRPD